MSYDIIKNGIVGLLNGIKFQESSAATIAEVPSQEMGNVFLLTARSGENNERSSETLSDRFYDNQIWEIQVPFSKNQQSHQVQSDEINRARDLIIKTVDNPANWEGYVRIQKFLDWSLTEEKNYFLLTVRLKVVDTIIY